jgi:hypothetical protein
LLFELRENSGKITGCLCYVTLEDLSQLSDFGQVHETTALWDSFLLRGVEGQDTNLSSTYPTKDFQALFWVLCGTPGVLSSKEEIKF